VYAESQYAAVVVCAPREEVALALCAPTDGRCNRATNRPLTALKFATVTVAISKASPATDVISTTNAPFACFFAFHCCRQCRLQKLLQAYCTYQPTATRYIEAQLPAEMPS
jgi:hypothetical protein